MTDLSQTIPSQLRLTNSKPFKENLNKSLSPKPPLLPKPQFAVDNLKNGKLSPVKKIQSSSQTIITVKNVVHRGDLLDSLGKEIQEQKSSVIIDETNRGDSLSSSKSSNEKRAEKPQAFYPKPELPPKTNACRISRQNKFSIPSTGINSPQSPQKILENDISLKGAPVRPPRSPKRILKSNPFEEFQNRLALSDSLDLTRSFNDQRQKSASLPRCEFVNWTLRELNKNSKAPIKYYQQINKTSDQKNFTIGREILTPTPTPRPRTKPKLHLELDLAGALQPIYAAVDYSKKKNRQNKSDKFKQQLTNCEPQCNDQIRRSSDSVINYRFQFDDLLANDLKSISQSERKNLECIDQNTEFDNKIKIDVIYNYGDETNNNIVNPSQNENIKIYSSLVSDVDSMQNESFPKRNANNNQYNSYISDRNPVTNEKYEKALVETMNSEEMLNEICGNNSRREEANSLLTTTIPQSFLHRFVNNFPKAKEENMKDEGNGDNGNSNEDNSSFLHKFNDKKYSLVRPNDSTESFEIVHIDEAECSSTEESSTLTETIIKNSTAQISAETDNSVAEQEVQVNPKSNVYNDKKFAEYSSHVGSYSEEGLSLGKKFLWFGSFGKGNKKRLEKKERCASQFYATPITLQEDININDCSRAKSLPNIKTTEKTGFTEYTKVEKDCSNRDRDSTTSEFTILSHNSDVDDDKDSINGMEISSNVKTGNKAFLIAKELMTSEEVFIDVLKLLNVEFRNYVLSRSKDKSSGIPQNVLNKILNHLPELQTLNEVLLADLKKRIQNWETNPKISDVIVKKGAFLKLYTSYIQNFESQTKFLDECVVKYPKFGKILKEFESLDRCRMLSLKHYMLKPVQRIPQYRLLLSDYLKNIDETSPDYEDTENALRIVSEVADHVNRNLKYGDKNGTLMHFQSLLSDYELIRPGRELIKDGPLEKICRKSVKDRYFILLNDCLLHTTYSKNSLKIHQELPLSGMKVYCNEEQKHPNSFTMYSTTRSFILCAKTETERNDWVQSLQSAIKQNISRQQTFMNVKIPESGSFKIGKEAPVWIQDNKVTMCQICTAEFTSLFRRHHCRACGKVICKNCGGSQAPLQYDSFKAHRVCDQCFPILLKDYEESEDEIYEILKMNYPDSNYDIQNLYLTNKAKFIKYTSTSKPKFIPPRLKEVPANDAESEMNGLLYRKSRKTWKLYWYVLKEHVLYVYRASEDVKALETIPVLGYEVRHSEMNYENVDKNLIFILEHRHQSPIIFHAETEESAERWYEALKKASEFREPSDS